MFDRTYLRLLATILVAYATVGTAAVLSILGLAKFATFILESAVNLLDNRPELTSLEFGIGLGLEAAMTFALILAAIIAIAMIGVLREIGSEYAQMQAERIEQLADQ